MSDRRPQDLDGVSPHDNTSFAARRPYAPTPGPLPVAFASTDITTLISSRSFLRLAVAAPSERYSTSTFAMTGRRAAWRSSALLLFLRKVLSTVCTFAIGFIAQLKTNTRTP